ncbi:MAG: uroporphyrinogen-III C-methyltransferase [Guyparkeria sp.]
MDKKDNDKQAEETKTESTTPTGKSSASPASADKGSASQNQSSGDQVGQAQANKAAADKKAPPHKVGAGKSAAKSGSKASEKPPGSSGDSAGNTKPSPSASDAPASKAAQGKPSGDQGSATSSSKGGGANAAAKTPSSTMGRPPRRSATPWLVVGMLILFGLAAVGGWQLWQLQQAQQQGLQSQASEREALGQVLDQEIERLDEQLDSTRSTVSSLEERGEEIRREVESGLQAQQDELVERQDYLDARIARIDDRLSRGEIAWKTAEIGFLLTRAQERLSISRDPNGAMLALQLADQRVAALSRPHWLPLRSAISDAIARIEASGEGDRVGQALALRRITDRVEDWPLTDEAENAAAGNEAPSAASAERTSLPEDAAWYEKAWAATTGWVTRQVTVTRSDTPTRLRERVATDREMRLWLTAVRESLLSRDHEALSTTLTEARDWLESHYATDAGGPAKALQTLERTRERFASREFPSIDSVLDAWERASTREKARAEMPVETGEEDPS